MNTTINSILSLVGLFANVGLAAAGAAGVVSPTTSNLVTGLIGGTSSLISTLISTKSSATSDILAVLAGLSSILDTLIADPNLPADKLAAIKLLDGEVTAAIAAYVSAGKGFDASNYSPIPGV